MSYIINNLSTLQFESCLSTDQQQLVYLRTKSHALSVHACALASFITSVLRDARLIATKLNAMGHSAKSNADSTFRVGIIGCGRIGRLIANSLLSFGELPPSDLSISTRRPELLTELMSHGVQCVYDNAAIAQSVSLLFVCCLPSQLLDVSSEVRSVLPRHTLVLSLVSATPVAKVSQLFSTCNVLCPNATSTTPPGEWKWSTDDDVDKSLSTRSTLERTCPLSPNKHESPVSVSDHVTSLIILAVLNSLTSTSLSARHKLSVVNGLILGHTKHSRQTATLQLEDFQQNADDKLTSSLLESNALFDLCARLTQQDTALDRRLLEPSVRSSFVTRYCDVFQQHLNWLHKAGLPTARRHLDIVTDC